MNNQKQLIVQHLLRHNSINWIEAMNIYYIGGGFRMRISEIRKVFEKYNIVLFDRSVKNKNNSGEHYEYFLDSENKYKLNQNYSSILKELESKKVTEKQLQIF